MAPRIDPCGSPEVTGKGLDVAPNIALAGIDCVGTILAMLAGSPQNHTDVASLRVPRGLLCQKPLTCPGILYRLVLLYPALCFVPKCQCSFPVVLIFQKRTYKERLLCYDLLLILKPCCNYHCICASLLVQSEIWAKNNFLSFFEKCLFSVFLHIEAQLSLKNARLPPVFFLDFNSR